VNENDRANRKGASTMNTKMIRALALLGVTATLMPFGLMAQGPARFNLPFGFTVGTKYMEPGSYSVSEVTPPGSEAPS
jgi:hypothetical protein